MTGRKSVTRGRRESASNFPWKRTFRLAFTAGDGMCDAKGVSVVARKTTEFRKKCHPLAFSASFSHRRLVPLPHFLIEFDGVEDV